MTGGALAVYDRIVDPIPAINAIGEWIGKSGMAGCKNVEAGKVVALVCMSRGIDIFDFVRTYHIVDDKPTMKADAMLAEFRTKYGGDHEVLESSATRAAIKLMPKGKKPLEFELTWDEAQHARWPWRDPTDHAKGLKSNWSTPSDRQDMLWARCISRALRKMQPEIVAGIYTPEEVADFEYRGNGEARQQQQSHHHEPVEDVEQFVKQLSGQSAAADASADDDGDLIDANFEVVSDDGGSTVEQRGKIRELFGALQVTDEQIATVLAKRGVSAFHQLSSDQADELIAGLTQKLAGKSRMPEAAMTSHETGPADEVTVAEIKRLLEGEPALIKMIAAHLHANGKQKISDLSQADAVLLKNSLEIKSMEEFFGRSLMPGDGTPF